MKRSESASLMLALSPTGAAVTLVMVLAGCATQAPPPPPPAPQPAVLHSKHKPPPPLTAAEILAAQSPETQRAIRNHRPGGGWPTFRSATRTVYPYEQDAAPRVDCAPLRTTDIQLEAGETVTDLALGDAQRWMAVPAAAGDPRAAVPHVVVKPEVGGIATNLTIYTTKRIYRVELHTGRKPMEEVEFYFPDETLAAMTAAERLAKQPPAAEDEAENESDSFLPDADPSRLNFSYKISGTNVPWKPTRVFDDGSHVFLEMPPQMQTASAPALLLDANGGTQMANYRVRNNYFIVDRLFDRGVLVSGVGRDQDRVLVTYSGTMR